MMRGTFANIRIRNRMLDNVEGGFTKYAPTGEVMPIYDAAMLYKHDGRPLVVIAGKEYGTGSSRDWAAKGTVLLGVRAVIAESFERIHRSNLVGMGVLPLQFREGENAESLGLTGAEKYTIERHRGSAAAAGRRSEGHTRQWRGIQHDRSLPDRYLQRARIFPRRRNPAVCAAEAGRLTAIQLAVEIAGWIGALLILLAYLLLSAGKLTGQSLVYQGMNVVGSSGVRRSTAGGTGPSRRPRSMCCG